MISIDLHENSVFTHNAEDLSVGVCTFGEGIYGELVSFAGKVRFPNRKVAEQFFEQMELMLERRTYG